MKLRLGTRASDLAQAQSRRIARHLVARGHEVEFVLIKTEGDRDQTRPFLDLGPAGLFVRALEDALLDSRIDLAVHSFKDVPSLTPSELAIAAMPERLDARDRLILQAHAHDPEGAGGLPIRQGMRVGTASARRVALLRALRPDLEVGLLRGNVPTRLAKLTGVPFDAILLATAGLLRLDDATALGEIPDFSRREFVEVDLDPTRFVPAASQGALALQIRAEDEAAWSAVHPLDDAPSHRAVHAERRLQALVEAGCQVPFGAWCEAQPDGVSLALHGFLERDGRARWTHTTGVDPDALAQVALAELLGEGAPS
ncbi:MAG: hydroxymethylbilane synthase [Planctomycetes bacterium]|nr:hydroxymethylbilane synthase [Planctomycetota bacterium]MCB9910237.1 hydroxymethylbilane synthase [Planctomycetota bacterium]HPF12844.1 hydroxymethylbilane synthase [Planctomycetota bacterium]HRV83057.1 hydroxymethylbilane synthase [Planctomycetota bacterium]